MSELNINTLPLTYYTAQQGVLGLLLIVECFNTQTAFIESLDASYFDDFNLKLAYRTLREQIMSKKKVDSQEFIDNYEHKMVRQDFMDCCEVLATYSPQECVDMIHDCHKDKSFKSDFAEAAANFDFANPETVVRALDELSKNYKSKVVPKNISYLHELASEYEFAPIKPGIPITYSETMDVGFNGWQNGMYLVGAKPGLGKTNFTIQASLDVAKQGYKVLYFQLEVSQRMIFDKYMANITGLAPQQMKLMFDRQLHDGTIVEASEYNKQKGIHANIPELRKVYSKAKNQMEDLCIKVTDKMSSQDEIEKAIIDHYYKGLLDFVIIDYVGLVETDNPRDPEWQRIAEFSTKLTRLTVKYGFTALLVVQFNKGTSGNKFAKSNEDDEITMDSISGGSIVAKNATGIMILTQDKRMIAREKDPNATLIEQLERSNDSFCKVTVLKNRLEGYGGSFYFGYKKPLSRFEEVSRHIVDSVLKPFEK